jgi:hypothetical protein
LEEETTSVKDVGRGCMPQSRLVTFSNDETLADNEKVFAINHKYA